MTLSKKLIELCEEHKTSEEGIKFLVNYYVRDLHWSQEEAERYTIELFENGTIDEIKIIGGAK